MPRSRSAKKPPADLTDRLKGTGFSYPVPLFLLLTALVCLIVGCVARDELAPDAPDKKTAPSLDSQDDRDWMHRNQFKTHMRHLWIDSNRIVSAGRGDLRPTFREITPAAADIRERAELMGGYWTTLREQAEEMEWILDDEDRIGATQSLGAIGAACDGCHMATWSPAYLHVTTNTLDSWLKNQVTPVGENEQDMEAPPTNPNRTSMQRLWRDFQSLETGINVWDVELARESVKLLLPELKRREQAWKQIAQSARALETAATNEDAESLRKPYETIKAHCAACHARLTHMDQTILNPMPWDGAAE